MQNLVGFLGVIVILGIGYSLSTHRGRIHGRTIVSGLILQFVLAFLLLRFPPIVAVFNAFATAVTKVISFADEGSVFIFGKSTDASGPWGFIFAVKVLPIIIFFAALMAVLYHIGVMQRVVAILAWGLRKTLQISGAEALSASANIFLGQTEAPLTVKPFIASMTRSQIMTIMVGGFASIAGSVMAAYIVLIGGADEETRIMVARHFMTASVMSAPAGIVMAKLMMPETEVIPDESLERLESMPRVGVNILDAAAEGTADGLRLALNVGAMLVAFVALLAMLNYPLTALSEWEPIAAWRGEYSIPLFTFQNLLGYIFTPLAWCLGVGSDAHTVGSLMGQQVIATEFVAYMDLSRIIQDGGIAPRSAAIATFALCGFANLPSIAIQIGGLSAMAPNRRADFAQIGFRAMVAGALACWMTGAVAGVFIE